MGGISIPVLIHILNRRRSRIVDWAAMRFLIDALRKNRRRLRIEELILLVLRCLIILLLGFGLARFSGCGAVDALGVGNGGRAAVFIVDDSYSMGQSRGDSTALGMARADLATALEPMTARDQVGILLTSHPEAPVAFFPFGTLSDPATLTERLDAIQPSDRRTRLVDAMQTAAEWFEGIESGDRRLYLMSDIRRVDVTAAADVEALRDAYSRLSELGVKVVVMDYGKDARRNLTLERIELVDRFAAAGKSASIRIAVRNHGGETVRDTEIQIRATFTRNGETKTVKLPVLAMPTIAPGEVWQTTFDYTPEEAGSTVIAAELPADELPGDNAARLALDVREAIRVLIIDGKPATRLPEDAASYFLRIALDPTGRGEHGFDVDVMTQAELATVDFRPYHVVFLLNVSSFPLQPARTGDESDADVDEYPSLTDLEQFVRDGGGVAIYTGDRVDTGFYNGRMYANGRGLSPLPIHAAEGDPDDRGTFIRMDPESISPAVAMGFFDGEAAALTQLIRFFAFTPADDEALAAVPGDAEVPIIEVRFNDPEKHPAVVSRSLGRGRCVMIYSTASLAWNDWALDAVDSVQGLYVLFVADLAESLARGQRDDDTRPVGATIHYDLSGALRDAVVTLRPPAVGADLVTLAPQRDGGQLAVAYSRADEAGIYHLQFDLPGGSQRSVLFVRNVDPVEGDLAAATEVDLDTALGDTEYVYVDRSEPDRGDIARAGERKEYWMWAIGALLAFLAMEGYLGRKFGHWS
ncbi:MAG: VWA domain-containing protein [Phycisphaerae bacterium]|nr:VWA domain-containing protein [Phycisphaerae bacterium]